jgi:hypothetical protein
VSRSRLLCWPGSAGLIVARVRSSGLSFNGPGSNPLDMWGSRM